MFKKIKTNELSLEEKIGQMIIISMKSKLKDNSDYTDNLDYINKYNPGGIMFMGGTAEAANTLINNLKTISRMPMFFALDTENSLGVRFTDIKYQYPTALAFGSIGSIELVKEHASILKEQCLKIGINMSYGIVADINYNFDNPVIGVRSYGNNLENVIKLTGAYLTESQKDNNFLVCVKHFPGHGRANKDSHKSLVSIDCSLDDLYNTDMQPFINAIKLGALCIMTNHVSYPKITNNQPITVSKNMIEGCLISSLKYKNIIITDSLKDMKGITNYSNERDIVVNAVIAGHDIILNPTSYINTIKYIKEAVLSGKILESRINLSVSKILSIKEKLGFFNTNTKLIKDNFSVANIVSKAYKKSIYNISSKSMNVIFLGKNIIENFSSLANEFKNHYNISWFPITNFSISTIKIKIYILYNNKITNMRYGNFIDEFEIIKNDLMNHQLVNLKCDVILVNISEVNINSIDINENDINIVYPVDSHSESFTSLNDFELLKHSNFNRILSLFESNKSILFYEFNPYLINKINWTGLIIVGYNRYQCSRFFWNIVFGYNDTISKYPLI